MLTVFANTLKHTWTYHNTPMTGCTHVQTTPPNPSLHGILKDLNTAVATTVCQDSQSSAVFQAKAGSSSTAIGQDAPLGLPGSQFQLEVVSGLLQ